MVHWQWPLMGGLLHLVQRGGVGRDSSPPSPLLDVPNVTAHPSTGSVPIILLLCGLICLWLTVGEMKCVWLTVGRSVVVTVSVVVVVAVLSLITTCCLYTRRQHIKTFIFRSCPQLHSACNYRQVYFSLLPSSLLPATRRVLRYIGLSVAVFLSASLYVSKRGAY